MLAAVINAVVDSGPTESCGEDPSRAYIVIAPITAQSPATVGTPATSAYAIT